jgi:drug/metabolite transporter (DMT)-like permease
MKWPRRSLGALGAGAAGAAGAASAAAGRASGLPGLPAAARAALGALMIALNALGLALFARALRRASSLQAATASLAANIALSGLVGRAAFGEVLGARWCAGAACILAGAALLQPPPAPAPARRAGLRPRRAT